ncbi:carbohydrate kinase family protein [Tessaracoccus antarcticus]|nr:PfkB family carbohydrate kinase [Tessaracoccus antarcticus]
MLVLVAGHCCMDITPELGDRRPGLEPGILYPAGPLRFKVGGSGPNTSGTLLALGADTELAVTMGEDELGQICRTQLAARGGRVRMVDSPLSSSYSIVVEHGQHDRTFWQHEGSNATFDPRQIDLDSSAPGVLHIGYPSLLPLTCEQPNAMAETFAAAKQRGITTSLDLAHVGEGSVASKVDWRAWFALTLPFVDVCTPSWDDVTSALHNHSEPTREKLEQAAEELLAWGVAVVSLSAGSLGFALHTGSAERLREAGMALSGHADAWADQQLWFPADRSENPVTTVGAGDSLTAGLLHAIINGMTPMEAGMHARTVVGRHLRQIPLR